MGGCRQGSEEAAAGRHSHEVAHCTRGSTALSSTLGVLALCSLETSVLSGAGGWLRGSWPAGARPSSAARPVRSGSPAALQRGSSKEASSPCAARPPAEKPPVSHCASLSFF